ncbi:MAG: hypothetical protein CMK36_10195 [Porticoccaceae bacterium]|nr:hypothetical protein [Porticoccaceae bacterium]
MLNTDTVLIAATTFVAGIILGYLASFQFSKSNGFSRSTSEDLKRTKKEHSEYKNLVNQHMIKLSEQTRKLARNYRDIHEQLTLSSARLASQEVTNQIFQHHRSGFFSSTLGESSRDLNSTVEPPKDYAPKVPGGILSEEYGLQDNEQNLNVDRQNDEIRNANGSDTPSKKSQNFESATPSTRLD